MPHRLPKEEARGALSYATGRLLRVVGGCTIGWDANRGLGWCSWKRRE